MAFNDIMLWQVEIMNLDRNSDIFMLCKIIVMCQESKSVGTDVIQLAFDDFIFADNCNTAAVRQIHTGIFPAVVDLRTGFNLDHISGAVFSGGWRKLCVIPAVQYITDCYLQLTLSRI